MTFAMPAALIPARCDPEPRNTVRSGGRSVTGFEQRVMSDAGYWEVRYSDFAVFDDDTGLAWDATRVRMRQNEPVIMPVWRALRSPGSATSQATAVNVNSALLSATTLTIRAKGIDLKAGAYFSIGDQYLQIVQQILSVSGTPSLYTPLAKGSKPFHAPAPLSATGPQNVDYVCKVWPPLSAALAANASLDFRNPKFHGILVDINDGDTSLGEGGRFGLASIILREP